MKTPSAPNPADLELRAELHREQEDDPQSPREQPHGQQVQGVGALDREDQEQKQQEPDGGDGGVDPVHGGVVRQVGTGQPASGEGGEQLLPGDALLLVRGRSRDAAARPPWRSPSSPRDDPRRSSNSSFFNSEKIRGIKAKARRTIGVFEEGFPRRDRLLGRPRGGLGGSARLERRGLAHAGRPIRFLPRAGHDLALGNRPRAGVVQQGVGGILVELGRGLGLGDSDDSRRIAGIGCACPQGRPSRAAPCRTRKRKRSPFDPASDAEKFSGDPHNPSATNTSSRSERDAT